MRYKEVDAAPTVGTPGGRTDPKQNATMQTVQDTPPSPPESDEFLSAIAGQQQAPVVTPTASMLDLMWRIPIALLAFAALVVGVVALSQGADREAPVALSDVLAERADTIDIALDPAFPGTDVLLVANQNAMVVASGDDAVSLRIVESAAGAIVGLTASDQIVALAAVLPAFADQPQELRISATSTALALVALHPDISSSEPGRHLAGVATALRSPAFAVLVDAVDGNTPLASLDTDARQALADVVLDTVEALPIPPSTCPESFEVAPFVVQCEDSLQMQNSGSQWVLVIDADDQPCAAIPPATLSASDDERASLGRVLQTEQPFDQSLPFGVSGEVGTLDPVEPCGDIFRPAADPDLDLEVSPWIIGYGSYANDAAPLARLVGAEVSVHRDLANPDPVVMNDLQDRVPVGTAPLTPAERIRAAEALIGPGGPGATLGVSLDSQQGYDLVGLGDLLVELYE